LKTYMNKLLGALEESNLTSLSTCKDRLYSNRGKTWTMRQWVQQVVNRIPELQVYIIQGYIPRNIKFYTLITFEIYFLKLIYWYIKPLSICNSFFIDMILFSGLHWTRYCLCLYYSCVPLFYCHGGSSNHQLGVNSSTISFSKLWSLLAISWYESHLLYWLNLGVFF
jgi:hypothetical protein